MRIFRRKKKRLDGLSALDLIEQTFALFRSLPLSVGLLYHIGTLPFILGLFYFWTEMSRSSFAFFEVESKAIQMALLFIWMKCWQTVFYEPGDGNCFRRGA